MNNKLPPALDGAVHELPLEEGRVVIYAIGSGPPMLLVHSVNAVASAAEVRPLFEHFGRSHSVYALDLPGYGLSERSDRAYTVRIMTDAVLQAAQWIAQRHDGTPIDAVAVSLSCEFLARATVEQPQLFRSLCFVSPTGWRSRQSLREAPGSTRYKAGLDRFLRGPGWGGFLFAQLTRPRVIRYFLERTWGSRQIDETLWAYACKTARHDNAQYAPLAFLSGILFSTDIHLIYERIALPTLVVHGSRGDFTDYGMLSLVRNRSNWRISKLESGAMPYFESGNPFFTVQQDFLQALPV
jgi:pimeloyl-ACP methyl ester carboxylesterase